MCRIWNSFSQRVESSYWREEGVQRKFFFFHKYMSGLRQNCEIRKSVSLTMSSYHLALPQIQRAWRYPLSKGSPMSHITIVHSSLNSLKVFYFLIIKAPANSTALILAMSMEPCILKKSDFHTIHILRECTYNLVLVIHT